ncbi:MAG: hypothetical protein B6D55_06335 [Candidatus Omnitrophica bacterium 4484_70.2]|nr:MAG: hypothetical protein B6D55_06335 [Candidatus Omnitrophica bacterium 4484_70.2]
MRYKVSQIIEKAPPNAKRNYPVVKVFLEDESGKPVTGETGKPRVVKVFFDAKEGEFYDLELSEVEFNGVKELKGKRIKENKKNAPFNRSYANTREGVILSIKAHLFESILGILAQAQELKTEKIEEIFNLGKKLIFEEETKKPLKLPPPPTEKRDFIEQINAFLKTDFEKAQKVISGYLEKFGKKSLTHLTENEQMEILFALESGGNDEG